MTTPPMPIKLTANGNDFRLPGIQYLDEEFQTIAQKFPPELASNFSFPIISPVSTALLSYWQEWRFSGHFAWLQVQSGRYLGWLQLVTRESQLHGIDMVCNFKTGVNP
nr:hypothetical protein [Verminephrobacter eiseniae]